jgi:hypothetical protein
MSKPYLPLLLLLLSGCAYEWHHPQKGKEALYADSQQCEMKALRMYPQILSSQEVRPGYQQPATTNCSQQGAGQTTCTTVPGVFVPPDFKTVDINQRNRQDAVFNCLRSLGWTLEKRQ